MTDPSDFLTKRSFVVREKRCLQKRVLALRSG